VIDLSPKKIVLTMARPWYDWPFRWIATASYAVAAHFERSHDPAVGLIHETLCQTTGEIRNIVLSDVAIAVNGLASLCL
jgi:hypothetical protein